MTFESEGQLAPAASALLESGDRLSRCEFERRYLARPDIKKAELIEGIVHRSSPVRARSHAQPTLVIACWIGVYCSATPHVLGLDNATVRLDLDNEPQPDLLLRIEADAGGQSTLSEDDYIEGAPELIVEVAASSVSYDIDKLNIYRRNGVAEYVVWRVHDRALDWFALGDDGYAPLRPDADGIYESRAFPGLRLDMAALLANDLAGVLAELQDGLATPEHAAFAAELAARVAASTTS